MDKEFIIDLTRRVYRQTLLFPKKEPLRYKLREVADDILSEMVEWNIAGGGNIRKKDIAFEVEKNLEIIKTYFGLIKWQNWVSYFDIIKLEDDYLILGERFREELELEEEIKKSKDVVEEIEKPGKEILDIRKQKILDILKDKERIQVKEIKEIMPKVSKRTIRRDFDTLLKTGLVSRVGENNNTFYKLN
jgi:hypothetical protein